MLENFDKDYLKRIFIRVAAFIGGILLAAYIGYQIWHSVTSFVETEVAAPFTVTEKSSGEGYVFREETIITSASGGSLVPSVTPGEKVQIGGEVARIYTSSEAETEARMTEIDRQISLLSDALGDGELTNRDVSKLDSEAYGILTEMKKSIAEGDYSGAIANRTALLTKINKRNVASGATSDITARIQALQNEKSSLVQRLGRLEETVCAPTAGWYYPETDGYEDNFSVSRLKDMTYDSFKELIALPASQPANSAGKIVTNCKWYFACESGAELLSGKKVGEEYTFYFTYNQSEKIGMTLENIYESEDKKNAVAVYSTDKMPSGFDFARMQNYEILENEYTGFSVPKSAVRITDGQMGVYVLTGEVVHFRKIDVLTEYEGNYIVKMTHDEPKEPEEAGDSAQDAPDTSAARETASAEGSPGPQEYSWLGLNENIIVSGKGLREGRIITNPE